MDNLLLLTDSYKHSHWKQYPPGTQEVYSYFESRTDDEAIVFFGLQYILRRYLAGHVVTPEKINAAEAVVNAHMGPGTFNRAGWDYIWRTYQGWLPIEIQAVPEGTVVDSHNVLMTVRNLDPQCYWLTNVLETLLVQVWYPCTVASLSRRIKETIAGWLEVTGDPAGLPFKLHDFGFRGVSSVESAAIGGAAHLVNFQGTDTMAALTLLREYYGAEMAGFSIPAAEHSTITSWGRDGECDAFANMLDQYPSGLVAVVSDSYDIDYACRVLWGSELRDRVLTREGCVVIRPDSGDPTHTVLRVLETLGEKFGTTTNAKGYRVLPPQLRVIQGDGVTEDSINQILAAMAAKWWSADNIAFGMGGALLQRCHRDTHKFAFKCSSVVVDGEPRDVWKAPIGAADKASKRGKLALVHDRGCDVGPLFRTVPAGAPDDLLQTVFRRGLVGKPQTLEEIRERAALHEADHELVGKDSRP